MYLYLGDDDMTRAAAYLGGIMTHFDIPFERVDSTQSPPDDLVSTWYDGYILSDYPCKNFNPGQLERIRDAVAEGAGLLMLGGWESFHGRLGEYHNSPLAEVLPVNMADKDDRCNFAQPVMLYPTTNHPILDGLPWDHPPFIGGFNRFASKPNGRTLLSALVIRIRIADEGHVIEESACIGNDILEERLSALLPSGDALFVTLKESFPMLVVGRYGKGKVAAMATDVAPHWVGGFVDWGVKRITQNLPDGGFIEVGADYAKFFAQLVRWTGEVE